MKKKSLLILVFVLIALGFYFAAFYKFGPFSHIQRPIATTPSMIGKSDLTEEVLVGWILKNSNRISPRTAREIAREVIKTEMPLLILALIMAESEFVPTAVSNKDAIGLTQVHFEVHGKELIRVGLIKEKRDLFDIGPSIHSGYFIFDMYLKQSQGNVEKAMELYLGGKDGVYVRKISLTLTNLYVLSVKKRKASGPGSAP